MAQTSTRRPWWAQPTCLMIGLATILVVGGLVFAYFSVYQGRDISRITGQAVRISLPACITSYDQIVSISFHSRSNGETIKDVTYRCDGKLFSQEYNDFGVFQGSIEWTLQSP
jgi:hypothetical protein